MTEENEGDRKLINTLVNPETVIEEDKKPLSLKIKIIINGVFFLIVIAVIIVIIFQIFRKNENEENQSDDVEVLPPIIIEPTLEYTHCIIWLHGWDNCPENFVNFFKKQIPFIKQENTKIILMRAPYQVITSHKINTTSWFDIYKSPLDSADSYNFTDATKSKKMVEKIINEEAKKLNGNYNKIYVGGHSQGACISLYTAYNFKELLGGVLACSGVLFPQADIVGDKNRLNTFLGHGTEDMTIPISFHNETVKRIENYEGVKKFYYQGKGHDIYDEEKYDMSGFLNETMN